MTPARQALGVVAAALAIVACKSATPTGATSTSTSTSSVPAPKRLLVVTHTTGFRHSSIETAEATLQPLGTDSGVFSVTLCRTGADVKQMLTAAALANVDGVFFANTTGNLGIPDLDAFLAWIRAGHPFLGAHSASDTYHDAPGFLEMIGGEFATHGDQTTVDLVVEDRTHPATVMLPSPFRIFDEIYEFKTNPRATASVLLSLDRHPNDGHPDAGRPGDFPIAWHRRYGEGRVFYTALGHREDVWTNATFQQHLLGAIRWAFGL